MIDEYSSPTNYETLFIYEEPFRLLAFGDDREVITLGINKN